MDPLDFWKKYTLVASTKTFIASNPSPVICRFCKQTEPAVIFKTVTHAVPELLGRNNFISFDECDACNNQFSSYESHLSIFFRPYLTMVGVTGKRKISTFQSRTENGNEATRTIVKVGDNNNRQILLSDINDYKIDIDNKKMEVTFRKPPHKPFWVYKSLVKIALSLLPVKYVPEYAEVIDWLMDKPSRADYFVTAFITILTRGKFSPPFAELYKARRTVYKNHFIPQMTLVLGFGNVMVQIFLPLSKLFNYDKTGDKPPVLHLFPSMMFDKNKQKTKYTITPVDLKSRQSVTHNETLHFSFQEGDFNLGKDMPGM